MDTNTKKKATTALTSLYLKREAQVRALAATEAAIEKAESELASMLAAKHEKVS